MIVWWLNKEQLVLTHFFNCIIWASEFFSRKARWMACSPPTPHPPLKVIDSEIVEEQQQHLLSLSLPQLSSAITQQQASKEVVSGHDFLTRGQNNSWRTRYWTY